MANLYDYLDPTRAASALDPARDMTARMAEATQTAIGEARQSGEVGQILAEAMSRHLRRMMEDYGSRSAALAEAMHSQIGHLARPGTRERLAGDLRDYLRDASERTVLTFDALRQRGDIFLEHEEAGCPPVLAYDYEKVMDGADLDFPSNYELLRILPPAGVSVDATRRPYIIIDPRAGHGPGIGGFKSDSQVGVALKAGHPVYFVSFRRLPEPGQYLSHVTRAEAAFVREVMRRHPQAPRPVPTGNCPGGWAVVGQVR